MGLYGQHMVPLHQGMGVPPQAYGYMPGTPQERPPTDVGLPLGPPPPPPMGGHLMQHAAPLPIYPGYSPQVRHPPAVLDLLEFVAEPFHFPAPCHSVRSGSARLVSGIPSCSP